MVSARGARRKRREEAVPANPRISNRKTAVKRAAMTLIIIVVLWMDMRLFLFLSIKCGG